MYIKNGASIAGLRSELLAAAITIIEPIYHDHLVNLVITSGTEKYKHKAKRSAHYRGDAIDTRSRDIEEPIRKIVAAELQHGLGQHYIVILESNHFHIEYSPIYEESP